MAWIKGHSWTTSDFDETCQGGEERKYVLKFVCPNKEHKITGILNNILITLSIQR